jgi:cytochrome c peroxidase
MTRKRVLAGALALPAFSIWMWGQANEVAPPKAPLGLPPLSWPRDNPYSAAKVELGRTLYFDRRLSADESVSCATCHEPRRAFTDGAPVSTGIKSQKGGRSAPTVINRAYSLAQFWDGRATTLEDQAKGPIANPLEMGMTHDGAVDRLKNVAGYRAMFAKAFGTDEINIDRAAKAIASFERTVLSGNAPYDRYKKGDKRAMTASQVRGMIVFFDKAKCDRCHEGSNFTLNAYSNLGVGIDKPEPDVGRFAVTKDPRDWGVFKTPTLREIEHTAPYMHDGSLKTLEEVVDFYNKGGIPNRNLDANIKKLNLSDAEKKDLVEFMKALSGEGWQQVKAPATFPQ